MSRTDRPLRVMLWSYNYDPEPTGIGILSTVWARALQARGHEVEVVAAHPHYPEPRWGSRLLPYREWRAGIDVLRLPLWVGRGSATERYRQEFSFMTAQSLAVPFLRRPDVMVSTSPSFPALLPAIAFVRARSVPWALWLHDVLPDGATSTGLVDERGTVITLARRLERAAYRTADRIVVLSPAFTDNLVAKGVPAEKIELIQHPATRVPTRLAEPNGRTPLRILSIGNIGLTQGLAAQIRAFEAEPALTGEATLRITGTGVAADDARAEVVSDRVTMTGLVDDARLEDELTGADVGFVSQRYDGPEFNIPSKVMNFMAYGLPVLAAVNPAGQVAQMIRESNAGWVVDSTDPTAFPREVLRLVSSRAEIVDRATASRHYAEANFGQARFVEQFERVLLEIARRHD